MLSRVLAQLEERGLVARAPQPGDARCTTARRDAGRDASVVAPARPPRRDPARAARRADPDAVEALLSALPALEALSRVDEGRP